MPDKKYVFTHDELLILLNGFYFRGRLEASFSFPEDLANSFANGWLEVNGPLFQLEDEHDTPPLDESRLAELFQKYLDAKYPKSPSWIPNNHPESRLRRINLTLWQGETWSGDILQWTPRGIEQIIPEPAPNNIEDDHDIDENEGRRVVESHGRVG